MKKIIKLFLLVLLLTVTLYGCDNNKSQEVTVTALYESISIKETEVKNYDYTTLFTITIDGKNEEVKAEYLNNLVKEVAGTYTITCEYQNKRAVTTIIVTATQYQVESTVDTIELKVSQVENYDFKTLYTTKIDGNVVPITADMISTDVKTEVGTYKYTVTVGNASKTITVKVIEDHYALIVKSYETIQIQVSEINDYDYTNLFTIYKDGTIIKTTLEMLDLTKINPTIDETFDVTLTYEDKSETVKVTVVKDEEIIVNAKNIITYPNSEMIDLTTLFEISKGTTIIPVTLDMISGAIDYTKEGTNNIVLTYLDKTYNATVEVKQGVVINYAKGNHVIIQKGTNQNTYMFSEDFIVIVNGIKFNLIPEKYLNLENVNFNEVGTYDVTISIPYIKKLNLSGATFDYVEKTITYDVREVKYDLTITEEELTLPYGTTSFYPYSNLKLKINDIKMAFTENPDWVNISNCYAQMISDEIDLNKFGRYEVKLEIYVYGVNAEPITVSYYVTVESNASITASDKVIFTGDTLYTKDLFELKINNEVKEIDQSLISGKVDTFTPGMYEITINYQGITKTSNVVVLDNLIKGTYKTNMKTLSTTEVDSSDETISIPGKKLGDMQFNDFENFTVNGSKVTVDEVISEKIIKIKIGSSNYTMYYYDGIIVFDPDNSIKLGFSDYRRPLVYFSASKYELMYKFDINYSDSHVLETTYSGYSIDTFQYRNIETNETKWFGLKIWLANKTSLDTIYEVTWGEVTYPEDFEMQTDVTGTIIFNDTDYDIIVKDRYTAKVIREEIDKTLYANKTFTGKINGQNATISVDKYGGYTIKINNEEYQSYSFYDLSQMKYGGINKVTNEIYIYICNKEEYQSAKFSVDPTTSTFTFIESDEYFGKYESENAYVFLDGYGSGVINFNKESYYQTTFNYQIINGIVVLKFTNLAPDFDYGTSMEFYLSSFLNRLTVKESKDNLLNGIVFDNIKITTGALIDIKNFVIGADQSTVRTTFYNNLQITTKDGLLSKEEKEKCLDLTKVSFSNPGFYYYTITITINGKKVSQIYPLQILEPIYDGNKLVATYGSGVNYSENSFMIDKYGRGILNTKDDSYEGNIIISGNDFALKAYNQDNKSISITGTLIAEGIVKISCAGNVNFDDYFTTGTYKTTGIKNLILQEFTYANNKTYILSKSNSDLGEVVEIELLKGDKVDVGSIIKIITEDTEYIIKIAKWNSTTDGFTLADDNRGTYTLEGCDDLVLDGFENATYGSLTGTYTATQRNITFISGSTIKAFKINVQTKTYEVVEVTLDNTLVEGKTYMATHTFTCNNSSYMATTSFTFEVGGKVLIKSSSSSHDDGDYACGDDTYNPPYENNSYGSYSVKGNKLTITVGEFNFEFVINDVITVSNMECTSTNISSDAHGYFKIGTIFTK